MDYLDPKKEFRHRIILFTGYILVTIAIVIAALVLLYQAYGFGVNKKGAVIQNGLTFFSSQPHPAKIYVDGTVKPVSTNTRLTLEAGIHKIELKRDGYFDWQRSIELDGGSVEHFDYPFLFPKSLTASKIQTYTAAPTLLTQSPDQRWLVVGLPTSLSDFEVYDLKNPTKAAVALSLPVGLVTKAAASETWQLGEWSGDNRHILLQHNFDGKVEFVLADRTDPEQSVNLSKTLNINPTKMTLRDKKYDQYYIYEASAGLLQSISLKEPVKTTVLQQVLAYQTYSDDTLLYVTDNPVPGDKVLVKMAVGDKITTIRTLPRSPAYVLDLTKYSGTMYVVVGASASNKAYIYKDPLRQLALQPDTVPTPAQVLHVEQPNYVSFSSNTQFIVVENATRFGVYDIENKLGYNYSTTAPLDSPVTHANWMDGDRLFYVSGGKLNVFDYDATNRHALMGASSNYLPAFAPNYKNVYTLVPDTGGQFELIQTSLLTGADR